MKRVFFFPISPIVKSLTTCFVMSFISFKNYTPDIRPIKYASVFANAFSMPVTTSRSCALSWIYWLQTPLASGFWNTFHPQGFGWNAMFNRSDNHMPLFLDTSLNLPQRMHNSCKCDGPRLTTVYL